MSLLNSGRTPKANLGMAIVEIAAIAEGLKTFVESLVLRALDVFKRIEDQIASGFDTPGLEAAVKRAVGLIKEVENDWTEKCRVAKDALNEASAVVTAAKEKVDGLMNEKARLLPQSFDRFITSSIAVRCHAASAVEFLVTKS